MNATEQLRMGFDVSNYISNTVSSGGDLTIDATGNDITIASTDSLRATGKFFTSATDSSSNLNISAGATAAAQSTGAMLLPGASLIGSRVVFRGSTNYTMSAGHNHSSLLIGQHTLTEAASGNHPILTQLGIRPLAVTAGAGTVSDTATFYIEDAATTTTVTGGNYSLWVDNGNTRLDGLLGIGTTTPSELLSVHGGALISGTTTMANLTATGTAYFTAGLEIGTDGFLKIPASASPTVDKAGKVALDTTSNNVVMATSSTSSFVAASATTTLYSFSLASTSPEMVSGGILDLPSHFLAQNITGIICHVDGGTSMQIFISDGTNDTNTITCTTTRTQYAFTQNTHFDAYEAIRTEYGTKSGDVDYLVVRILGYRTSD